MTAPTIQRDGDAWSMAWETHGVAMGMERLQETRDGLRAEITVESRIAGRVVGPVWLNILSSESQTRFANSCSKRVNGLTAEVWHGLVVQACAVVAKQYRAPTPTLDLSQVDTSHAVDYLIPGLVPTDETTVLYGDGECLAAGSVIQGPAGSERVEVLAKRGLPIPVWTLTPEGREWTWASAPWLKGYGTLRRFTLDGGRAITVADRHRFLTPSGWRFAAELAVGERLAVASPSPLPTNAGHDPRVSLLSAQHCSQTPEDCRGGCWTYCRRYDPPLRLEPDDAQAFAPSLDGARAHGGCAPSAARLSILEWRGAASRATQHSENTLDLLPSRRASGLLKPTRVCLQSEIQPLRALDHAEPRPSLPPLQDLLYRTIVAVSIVGEGDYYDLSVPGTENYLANGIWHHNSSKSLMALRMAASCVLGQPLPWLDRPTRTCPALYLDWETNPKTVAGRLSRIALGMQTAVPPVFYRQCFRSLQDELPSLREEVSKKQIGLVIVDSIGFAASGALTEDDTARGAMNALRQLSPATRLVVAHVSASTAQQTTGTARPFGSTFFWNGMRSGLELRRAEEGADPDSIALGLYHRKANDGEHHKPLGVNVLFDGRQGAVAFIEADVNDSPDLAARTTISSRLRALLRKSRAPLTTEDLALELEVPVDTVGRTLRRMQDVQQVEQGGGRKHPATWGLSADAAF